MQVKEAMCKSIKIISPDTLLREAAENMRECDCGYMPVGENDRITGTVTDRDIVIRAIAAGLNPDETTVDKIMTSKVFYCFEDDNVEEAAESMKQQQVRRLIVLNRDKRMTGVITIGDIARASNDNQLLGDIENCVARTA